VSFLHRHLIAHRDISIENVVLDAAIDHIDAVLLYMRQHRFLSVEHYEELSVVLIDPGQAVRHARKIPIPAAGPDYEYLVLDRHPPGKSMAMCPEHYRAAPYLQYEERLHYCGMQVDMWQAGVLLLYLITGCPPYEVQTSVYLELQGQAEWMRCISDQDLGNWIVAAPPGFGGQQAVRDLVSPECLELLEQMLHPEQARRITADAALTHRWYTGAQL
jgi:serine/threonine protein kinase